MYSIIRHILYPVREQKVFFVFLLLMSCVVIPIMCYATEAFPKPFVFSFPIFDCYLLTLVAFCLGRIRLSWILWIVCILLLGGEVFSMLCYQSPYSMTVLQLILETNGREATEFLAGHGVANQLLMSSVITLCVLLVSMLAVEFFKNKIRTWMSSFMIALLFLSACTQGYSYFRLWQAYTANVTTTIAENKYMPLRNSPFVRFLYGHALNVVSTRE